MLIIFVLLQYNNDISNNKNISIMICINNFSVTKEMRHLEDIQSRLVLVCNIFDNNPLYKGRFDDLYLKLSSVVGSIEDALSVFEHE